jgi:hypothetical protein
MKRELKIGGLVHGGGNVEVGGFKGGLRPDGMSIVKLDGEMPWRIRVRKLFHDEQ